MYIIFLVMTLAIWLLSFFTFVPVNMFLAFFAIGIFSLIAYYVLLRIKRRSIVAWILFFVLVLQLPFAHLFNSFREKEYLKKDSAFNTAVEAFLPDEDELFGAKNTKFSHEMDYQREWVTLEVNYDDEEFPTVLLEIIDSYDFYDSDTIKEHSFSGTNEKFQAYGYNFLVVKIDDLTGDAKNDNFGAVIGANGEKNSIIYCIVQSGMASSWSLEDEVGDILQQKGDKSFISSLYVLVAFIVYFVLITLPVHIVVFIIKRAKLKIFNSDNKLCPKCSSVLEKRKKYYPMIREYERFKVFNRLTRRTVHTKYCPNCDFEVASDKNVSARELID